MRTIQKNFAFHPLIVLCLALLLTWLGCGKSEYDRRMQTRIQQLRTTSGATESQTDASADEPAEGDDGETVDEAEDLDDEELLDEDVENEPSDDSDEDLNADEDE
jgi:hypothetical protein